MKDFKYIGRSRWRDATVFWYSHNYQSYVQEIPEAVNNFLDSKDSDPLKIRFPINVKFESGKFLADLCVEIDNEIRYYVISLNDLVFAVENELVDPEDIIIKESASGVLIKVFDPEQWA